MIGLKSKNIIEYIKLIQLHNNEPHIIFKLIFTQVSIYVSLFFTTLILCGVLIKDQIPRKLVS